MHNIPVFSPAITDGSIGDMIYFYNFSKKGMIIDPVVDVIRLRALSAHICDDSNTVITSSCAKSDATSLTDKEYVRSNKHDGSPTNNATSATVSDATHLLRGKNSAIILGGGLPRHHLLSNVEVDRVVSVGTGNYVDGCVSSLSTQNDMSAQLLHPST